MLSFLQRSFPVFLFVLFCKEVPAQNGNYTLECTTHSPSKFTLTLKNSGDIVPYMVYYDCGGTSGNIFLPPESSFEYPAVTWDLAANDIDQERCIFGPSNVFKDYVYLLAWVFTPEIGNMAIEMVYCDTRPNKKNRYKFASTGCQEDADGNVEVLVENPFDFPMQYYSFWCGDFSDSSGVIPPSSSIILSTVFVTDTEEPPEDKCFFSPDVFTQPLMLYFSFQTWAEEGIEQIINCYQGHPPASASFPVAPKQKPSPIIKLFPNCPSNFFENPVLEIRADAPAFGRAICKNGDRPFTTADDVSYTITGTFDQSSGSEYCQFYKKLDQNTYTLDVQFGWGEKQTQVLSKQRVKTVTCSYDERGNTSSSDDVMADWFLSPPEMKLLRGRNSSASFDLFVVDVNGRRINVEHVSIGRQIRLQAVETSGTVQGLRTLSCWATNGVSRYAILRAGCGDGLVFPKDSGFTTYGTTVNSPYFKAFKLKGGASLKFYCDFTVCDLRPCDGDSCTTLKRRKRTMFVETIYRVETSPGAFT